MTVNLIRSGSMYAGVPYAYASVAARGSLIFTAGACPLDDRGQVVGAGDVRAQASLAVANLATALAESGATLADVLKTTVFVASAERPTWSRPGMSSAPPSVSTTCPAPCSA